MVQAYFNQKHHEKDPHYELHDKPNAPERTEASAPAGGARPVHSTEAGQKLHQASAAHAAELHHAKFLIKARLPTLAADVLREIIAEAPGTFVAQTRQRTLDSLVKGR